MPEMVAELGIISGYEWMLVVSLTMLLTGKLLQRSAEQSNRRRPKLGRTLILIGGVCFVLSIIGVISLF